MLANDVIVKRVPFIFFWLKSRKLDEYTLKNIKNFIDENRWDIRGFGYGRVPGHRVYRVILKAGKNVDWNVSKRYF